MDSTLVKLESANRADGIADLSFQVHALGSKPVPRSTEYGGWLTCFTSGDLSPLSFTTSVSLSLSLTLQ